MLPLQNEVVALTFRILKYENLEAMIKLKRGLDLPITGGPVQVIETNAIRSKSVAILGSDYVGLKPTMEVKVGDQVKLGQVLFTDKKTPGVKFTSPGAGKVVAINRGAKRVLLSVVVELDDEEERIPFPAHPKQKLPNLERSEVQTTLNDTGLWTAFRTRPFSKVPELESVPHSIFVTAIDTNPLAADPAVVITENSEAFSDGLVVLTHLTDGVVNVCKESSANIPVNSGSGVQVHEFSGPHPAGLAGTHIHFLAGASAERTVWSINYQDVIAIGKLFVTGQLDVSRIISLAGPQVTKPCLVKTRVGASISGITESALAEGANRVISGSVLSGRKISDDTAFLGRYHQQVTVIQEGEPERQVLHYLRPGSDKHSVLNLFASKLMGNKRFPFNSSTNGSARAMVPVGTYETVMPLDILPTQLLRSLLVGDTDTARALGCLELDEEDLALCTYACPGKYEYGPILRENLTRIEVEG